MNSSSLKIAALKTALVVLATDVFPLNDTSLNKNDVFSREVPKIINSFLKSHDDNISSAYESGSFKL